MPHLKFEAKFKLGSKDEENLRVMIRDLLFNYTKRYSVFLGMNNPSSMPSASGSPLNYKTSNRERNSSRLTEDLINLLTDLKDGEVVDSFANLLKPEREKSSKAFSVHPLSVSTLNKNGEPQESQEFFSYNKDEIQF